MPSTGSIVSWLHFGDLHVTAAEEPNYRDFQALIDQANRHLAGAVDFAVLPGDNADDGTTAQFALVRAALDRLRIPTYILPGDHDFEQRRLDAFHDVLQADRLPLATRLRGHRCLFLDVVSAGAGGPDFRLGQGQLDWLAQELRSAGAAGEVPLLFMHTYPADLTEGAAALTALIARHRVRCVDMGHTHYNELANDGRTIYAATRSTGQVEEGPVGFSVAAVDGGVVSWRFKALAEPWPLVLITSPADRRLVIDPDASDQVVRGTLRVRAKVWSGTGIAAVSCEPEGWPPQPMAPVASVPGLWASAPLELEDSPDGPRRLTVRAAGKHGVIGEETIEICIDRAGRYARPPEPADGSDRHAIGHWPEKSILGTQLGPNRNGRQW